MLIIIFIILKNVFLVSFFINFAFEGLKFSGLIFLPNFLKDKNCTEPKKF